MSYVGGKRACGGGCRYDLLRQRTASAAIWVNVEDGIRPKEASEEAWEKLKRDLRARFVSRSRTEPMRDRSRPGSRLCSSR